MKFIKKLMYIILVLLLLNLLIAIPAGYVFRNDNVIHVRQNITGSNSLSNAVTVGSIHYIRFICFPYMFLICPFRNIKRRFRFLDSIFYHVPDLSLTFCIIPIMLCWMKKDSICIVRFMQMQMMSIPSSFLLRR